MVQNVDVNTPMVIFFWTKWMDEFVNYVVPIDLPTPCFSICIGLHEFFVFGPVIDPLMFEPHFVIPHV
jgi:hypothetical protein